MSDNTRGQKFWNRTGYMYVEGFGALPSGLDMKFEVEKYTNFNLQFKASVLGLSSEHINQLTVWNVTDACRQARELKVFAGYDTDSLREPIARGWILNAVPTSPPEMWLNFDCMCALKNKVPVEKYAHLHDVGIGEVADRICKLNKFTWKWKSHIPLDRKVNFMIEGSLDNLIKRFANAFNLIAVLDGNDGIEFYDTKPWNVISAPRYPGTVINTDNGLLMIGNIDMTGARVRTRLNDRYQLFEWVKLESTLIPSANGVYFVLSKKHVGHLRGNEWYTELELRRKG